MVSPKARENRVRRWAARLGYGLHKDRSRMWGINHQGEYMLYDRDTNGLVVGSNFDADLDEVEQWLAEMERQLRAK